MVSARVAVQTRLALAGRRAPVRKTRRTPIMARQVRLHRDAVFTRRRSDSKRAQKMRNNCRRLDARAGVCCANERQSNRKNPLRGKAAAYSQRGMRLCSRIALTGFPRGVADAQKNPPKPDHGSAGQAVSRCCLDAQAFRLEAARRYARPAEARSWLGRPYCIAMLSARAVVKTRSARGKCGTTVGGLTRAPTSVVQMSGNRIARTHCAAKRLRIRGAGCVCAVALL